MDLSKFSKQSPGKLVPTIQGQTAFVPAPLPPIIDRALLVGELVDTINVIGELRGAARRIANPNILIRPLQRTEALTSSAMEGTYTTSDKLLLAEIDEDAKTDESTLEVRNYLAALRLAQAKLRTYPMSHHVIKAAHQRLLWGLSSDRGSSKKPGEYRSEQNFIGSKTRKIEDARFVPPPPADAQQAMDDLEIYLNRNIQSDTDRLLDLALVHYQLETIHPFGDGNGRLGRMLVTLMSMSAGLFEQPLLYVSPAIETDKDEYIDLMFNVSAKGEWHPWISFFFQKIIQSCRSTINLIDKLINYQDELKAIVRENIRSANAIHLVDMLFETPAIDITSASERLSISYTAAKNLIEKLVDIGILQEVPGYYPRTFIARGITDVARGG